MTAAIFSNMTKLMEIHISETKTHVKGIHELRQNLAQHFTLQKYFEDITLTAFLKNEKCYGSHHCALSF